MVTITDVVLQREMLVWMLVLLASLAFSIWPFRRDEDTSQDDLDIQLSINDSDDSDEHIDHGVRLAMQGDIERAAKRFMRAIDSDPNDAAAHYNLALALDISGKHDEAKSHYERAAELAPESVEANINLGVISLDEEEIENAIEEFKKATNLNPEDYLTQYDLGCAYLKANKYREAVSCFIKAIKADPKNPEARFNLAIASRKAGCNNLAEHELRDFLILAGERFPIHSKFAEDLLKECTEEIDENVS